MLRPSAALFLASFLIAPATAFQAAAEKDPVVLDLIELARTDNRVQEHLHALSIDLGPRLTASHGLMKAEQWCRDQFAAFGLDSRLEEWGTFPVGFDRGRWRGGIVGPNAQEFEFVTMAWTAGTNGPVRGPALLYPSNADELALVKDRLDGAWLVRERSQRGRGRRGEGEADPVADAIAAAKIAGIVRSAGGELLLTGGNHEIEWSDLPKRVEVVVRGDQHTALVERLKAGEKLDLEFDVDNRFFEGPVKLNNVVADLRGSERPDEYVIVCGHLDSWDGAQGTVDNGTGVSTTLEAARLLSVVKARPKRTIRFLLWSGEEQGLLGSRAYVKANEAIMPKVSAVLNHDGGSNYLSGLTITEAMQPQLEPALAPLIGLNEDFPFELRTAEGIPTMGSSDHASFVRAGVPGFFWNQAGRSNYNHMHHTQFDTFETAIPEYQEHSALVAAIAAYRIANMDELLDRTNMVVEQIPPRRMGVELDAAKVLSVNDEGKAKAAGWQAGDVIVAVDGVAVATQVEIVRELQAGGPKKTVSLKRGEQTLETVLDYTDDPDEAKRAERAAKRAAAVEARAQRREGDGQ